MSPSSSSEPSFFFYLQDLFDDICSSCLQPQRQDQKGRMRDASRGRFRPQKLRREVVDVSPQTAGGGPLEVDFGIWDQTELWGGWGGGSDLSGCPEHPTTVSWSSGEHEGQHHKDASVLFKSSLNQANYPRRGLLLLPEGAESGSNIHMDSGRASSHTASWCPQVKAPPDATDSRLHQLGPPQSFSTSTRAWALCDLRQALSVLRVSPESWCPSPAR